MIKCIDFKYFTFFRPFIVIVIVICIFPGIKKRGHKQSNDVYFDTLYVVPSPDHDASAIKVRAEEKKVNLRYFDEGAVGVALDETTTMKDIEDLLWIFDCKNVQEVGFFRDSKKPLINFKKLYPRCNRRYLLVFSV